MCQSQDFDLATCIVFDWSMQDVLNLIMPVMELARMSSNMLDIACFAPTPVLKCALSQAYVLGFVARIQVKAWTG